MKVTVDAAKGKSDGLTPLVKAGLASSAIVASLRFIEVAEIRFGLSIEVTVAIMVATAAVVFALTQSPMAAKVGTITTLISPVGAVVLLDAQASPTVAIVLSSAIALLIAFAALEHWHARLCHLVKQLIATFPMHVVIVMPLPVHSTTAEEA